MGNKLTDEQRVKQAERQRKIWAANLALEADGEHWHGRPERQEYDARRDAQLLKTYGLPVVRLTGSEIESLKVN